MIPRICFLCGNSLSYEDYVATNLSIQEFIIYTELIEKERLCRFEFKKSFKSHELVKLWDSIDIELACCNCRRFLEEILDCKKATWELLKWANDERILTLKELGIVTQSDLQKLKKK